MIKIKHLLLLVCIAGCFAACKKDSEENFDFDAQFRADTTTISNFVKENDIPVLKDSLYGIYYQILAPGTGDVKYTTSTRVTALYTGRLLNGKVFDTTDGKAPFEFEMGRVIAGWQIGIQKIQKGGKIRLFIPSGYAYGNTTQGDIPPNSVLDFTVEVTDIK